MTSISQKTYLQNFLYLVRKAGSSDLDKIKKYIEESDKTASTKLNYYNSIISLLKLDPSLIKGDPRPIKEARDSIQQQINIDREKNNITPKQKKAMEGISHDDIIKLINDLKEKKNESTEALENYLMVKLIYDGGVLRNDLMDISLCKKKQDALKYKKNCIYIPTSKSKEATIYIHEYKTSGSQQFQGKPIIRNLDVDTTNDIREMMKDNRKYLFVNRKGEPLSSSSYSTKLGQIFKEKLGIPVSSTILRKIYHTHRYKELMDNMKTDAGNMGHSINTIQKNYIANTNINDE